MNHDRFQKFSEVDRNAGNEIAVGDPSVRCYDLNEYMKMSLNVRRNSTGKATSTWQVERWPTFQTVKSSIRRRFILLLHKWPTESSVVMWTRKDLVNFSNNPT